MTSALTSVPSPRHVTESVSGSCMASAGLIWWCLCRSAISNRLASRPRHVPAEFTAVPVIDQRVLVVSERFGKPAAQHRDRRVLFRRRPMTSRSAARFAAPEWSSASRAARIASRGHDALQLDRQRGDREFDVLELSRSSAHLPWRAEANTFHSCES